MFTSSIQQSYSSSYNSQVPMIENTFQSFASLVSQSGNSYASTHVNNFQKNYTAVPYLLYKVINDSQDRLVGTFNFQNETFYKALPHVRSTAADVYNILTSKRCNWTMIENFYGNLINVTGARVTNSFMQIHSTYLTQLMSQHSSFMLFNDYIMQLQSCLSYPGNDARMCMVQVSPIYNYQK